MAVVLKDGHYSLTYMEDGSSLISAPQERASFSIPYIPKEMKPPPDHNKPDKKEEGKDKDKGKDKPMKENRIVNAEPKKKKRGERGERREEKEAFT